MLDSKFNVYSDVIVYSDLDAAIVRVDSDFDVIAVTPGFNMTEIPSVWDVVIV